MNEELSQAENPVKQVINKPLRDEKGRLLPGNTANPNGRPKGKTLKEFQAELFRLMTDEEKLKWLDEHKVSVELRWKMAEGNPKNDVELSGSVNISNVLDEIEHGPTPEGQTVEDKQSLQDPGQEEKPDQVQEEQSPSPLQPEQVV